MSGEYPQNWSAYVTDIDNQPAIINVNLAMADMAPVADLPEIIVCGVHFKQSMDNGWPQPEENQALYGFEEVLTTKLREAGPSLLVGTITHNNNRVFFYYTAGIADAESIYKGVVDCFSWLPMEFRAMPDPTWQIYMGRLFPDAKAYQQMLNLRVVMALEQQGDQLHLERPVSHFVCASDETTMEAVADQLTGVGFKVLDKSQDGGADEEFPWTLILDRTHAADHMSVNEITDMIMEVVPQYSAIYDGWECEPQVDPAKK